MKTFSFSRLSLISKVVLFSVMLSFVAFHSLGQLTASQMVTHNPCNGYSQGSINLSVSGGATPYHYLWSNGQTTQDVNSLAAGNYTVTVGDAACYPFPTLPWTFTNTYNFLQHIVLIPSTASISINGAALSVGDYIGVFFTDGQNQVCGGYGQFTGQFPINVDAWGDDVATPAKDGFSFGETLIWKVWKSFDGEIVDMAVAYTSNLTCQGNFQANCMSVIQSLSGTYSPISLNKIIIDIPVTQPDAILPSFLLSDYSGFNLSMAGANDGWIGTTITGGTTPYSFAWSNGLVNPDLYNLTAGPYQITIADANLCLHTDSIFLTQPPFEQELQASGAVMDASCFGSCDGGIDLNVSGGTPWYSYFWNDSATVEYRTGLCAGSYSVTVTDQLPDTSVIFPWNYQTTSASHTTNFPANSIFVNQLIADTGDVIGVFYTNNGTLECGGYSSITGSAFSVIAYADDTATSAKDGFELNENFIWKLWRETDGIIVNMTGYYNLSQPQQNSFAPNGQSGIDSLIGTYNWQGGTQSKVLEFEISEPAKIVITTTKINVDTFLNTLGSISNTVTGGVSPYDFLWSTGDTGLELFNLDTGYYSLTVTDSIGCTKTKEFYVGIAPYVNMTGTFTKTHIDCYGNCGGSIISHIIHGVPPYTYTWSNGETTANIVNLCAGTYHLVVLDSLQISKSFNVTLYQPDTFSIDPEVVFDYVNGTNSIIELHPQGGQTPHTFVWSNGANTKTVDSLTAGQYSLTLTDLNNCEILESFTILDPISSAPIIDDIDCVGNCNGAIDLTVTGGTGPYNILWSTGETLEDIENLCPGTYTVSIQDYTTNYPNMPWSYSMGPMNHTILFNSSSTNISISGNPIEYGDYVGVFYNDNGTYKCGGYAVWTSSTQLITAWGNDPTTPAKTGFDGGETFIWKIFKPATNVVINMNANYYSNFSNQSTFYPNGMSGVFHLTGTYTPPAYNFQVTYDFTISGPDSLFTNASITHIDTLFNQNGSIDISPTGGTSPYTFLWSNGNTGEDLTTNTGGLFGLTITDANLCVHSDEFLVGYEPYLPMIVSSVVEEVSCNGLADGKIEITISDGYSPFSYQWSDGATTSNLSNLVAGTYSLTVFDLIDSLVLPVPVTEPLPLAFNATVSVIDTIYNLPGFINPSPSGGTTPYTFLWSNGGNSTYLNTMDTGWYALTVTDVNLCSLSANFYVAYNTYIPLTYTDVVVNVSCNGGNDGLIEIYVQGGAIPIQYAWSNGGTTDQIDNLTAGNYTLTITDYVGPAIVNFEITQPDPILVDFVVSLVDPVSNSGGEIDATVSGGSSPYNFAWNTGSINEDLLSVSYGWYQLTVSDVHFCQATAEVFVDFSITPPWHVTPTMSKHYIDFSNSSILQLNGMGLAENDFIGVFYDSSGTLGCGGYLVWKNQPASLIAFGDISATTSPEGFAPGEEFVWKIWDASQNLVHEAVAVYLASHPNQQYFAQSGNSGIDSLYTNSISGTVSNASKNLLQQGMVVVYQQTSQGYYAIKKGLVTNGEYLIEGLKSGSYMCYAIPQPGQNWGIPGYYTTENNWQGAEWINVQAHTSGVNITIDPVTPYTTGTAGISGEIMVNGDASYNPAIFDNEWFPTSTKTTGVPARNMVVLLFDSLQKAIDFRLTGAQGLFAFENLEYGTYFVKVEKAGLQAELVEVVLDAANPITANLNFDLNPGQVSDIAQVLAGNETLLFPNPAFDELNVVLPPNFGTVQSLEIFSQLGMKQNCRFSSFKENNLQVDLTGFTTGLYFLKLRGDKNVVVVKFIKQ